MADDLVKPVSLFDAATALDTLLSELIVQLVKSGALSNVQAAKVLLRAEGYVDALQFQKDPEDSPADHYQRIALHRAPVQSVLEKVERRLALTPELYTLRHRRRIVADGYRKNQAAERERLEQLRREIDAMLDELDTGEPLD